MKQIDISHIGEKFSINVSKTQFFINEKKIGYLKGEVENWDNVLKLGRYCLKKYNLKNIVNDLVPFGHTLVIKKDLQKINESKKKPVIGNFDVVIIGAGVIGSTIARELSRYNLKIAVVEKEADVADGATKANNGMIHPGNAVIPGTLKAKLNVKGNLMYDQFSKELGFKFIRTGGLITYEKGVNKILFLAAWLGGKLNKVPDFKLISGKKARKIDPNVNNKTKMAVWTGTAGFVDGFEVCIAAAENAATNGVKFLLNHEVVDIEKENNKINGVLTTKGLLKTKIVINSAGIWADLIAEFAGDRFYTIHPRKGVIAILDKNTKGSFRTIAAPGIVPKEIGNHSKGGGGERTVSGNPLFGPSAREVEDREDLSVTKSDLDYAYNVGYATFPDGTRDKVITYFAGLRAADYTEDFIIEESKIVDGFIHVAGIQSPGLASAPAIGEYVLNIVKNYYKNKNIELKENKSFNPIRNHPKIFFELSNEEKYEIIKKDPRYGQIICRCESITEGEIVECLHRPIPCTTIDGIKRRVRATAGRCQGGFCGPRLVEIMARELKISPLEVSQKGRDKVLMSSIRSVGGKNE